MPARPEPSCVQMTRTVFPFQSNALVCTKLATEGTGENGFLHRIDLVNDMLGGLGRLLMLIYIIMSTIQIFFRQFSHRASFDQLYG